jgi:hypothetical protein
VNFSWAERTNRIHRRDTYTIPKLRKTVGTILDLGKSEVTVMSGQMGMAAFYLAKDFFRQVRFVDRCSLVESSLSDCKLIRTYGLVDESGRIAVPYATYFSLQRQFETECRIRPPDVIFDLCYEGPTRVDLLKEVEDAGYEIVYLQTGLIATPANPLPGRRVPGCQFVAVSEQLA